MQSIILKSLIIIVAGMAVVGGAVFVGFRHASDVRGEITPAISPQTAEILSPGGGEADTYLRDLREGDYTTYTRMAFSLAVTLFLLGSDDDWHPLLSAGRRGAPPLFFRGELSCYPVSRRSSNASTPIGLSNWNPRRSTPLVKP